MVVRVVGVVVDRPRGDVVERAGGRPRHSHADLARLLEVGVAEPPLRVGIRARGVEEEVKAGLRVLVDLGRPEPLVAPLLAVVDRERAAGQLLPRGEVGRAIDPEVVTGISAVGGVGVVVTARLVVQDVGIGGRQRGIVVVRRVRPGARGAGSGRRRQHRDHREQEQPPHHSVSDTRLRAPVNRARAIGFSRGSRCSRRPEAQTW